MNKGKMYVVGTGPGGPRQTTLEALECMKAADAVLCSEATFQTFQDYIGTKHVICDPWAGLFDYKGRPWRDIARSDAETIELFRKERVRIREKILHEIRKEMATGKNIALIETGDPCLFGPSHWFIEGFSEEEVEILPGVGCFPAAMAALKKSSIPSYDARFVMQTAPMFLFGDGEKDDGFFDALPPSACTLVFYMGLWNLDGLMTTLRKKWPEDLPAAIVYHIGSDEKQRVIKGRLGDISDKARDIEEDFAGLIIVGECLQGNGGYRAKVENQVRI
jgi:precorrin-4 methylase